MICPKCKDKNAKTVRLSGGSRIWVCTKCHSNGMLGEIVSGENAE